MTHLVWPGTLAPTPSAPWWHHDFSDHVAMVMAERELVSTPAFERSALLIAAHRSPILIEPMHVPLCERAFDSLGDRANALVHQGHDRFDAWHRALFVEHGLSGNGLDYHDARNSFIPDVLDRRIGIPIALAAIGMAVGRRCNLRVHGVGMPGHFLLGCPTDDGTDRWVDPFHAGALRDRAGAKAMFSSMFGDRQFSDATLAPTAHPLILIRMVANLKQTYATNRDLPGLLHLMRLRTSLPGSTFTEKRELIRLLHNQGFHDDALHTCDLTEAIHPDEVGILNVERDRIAASLN